jgi:hypothetical protein
MIGGGLFEANPDRGGDAYRSSERGFGLTFAAIGVAVGLAKLWSGQSIGWVWLAGAAALAALALACPWILAPFNRLWGRLAVLLQRVVTPVVMLVVFVATVVPTGLIMRALGKDPLRLKPDPAAATYWIDREPSGPAPGTMKNQF